MSAQSSPANVVPLGLTTRMIRQRQRASAPLARRYQSGCWRVVEALGELDIAQLPLLRGLIVGSPSHVIFDLRRVTFIDAGVIGVLATSRRNQGSRHGSVRVAEPSRQVLKVLSITGLDTVLTIVPSFDEAFAGHDAC